MNKNNCWRNGKVREKKDNRTNKNIEKRNKSLNSN